MEYYFLSSLSHGVRKLPLLPATQSRGLSTCSHTKNLSLDILNFSNFHPGLVLFLSLKTKLLCSCLKPVVSTSETAWHPTYQHSGYQVSESWSSTTGSHVYRVEVTRTATDQSEVTKLAAALPLQCNISSRRTRERGCTALWTEVASQSPHSAFSLELVQLRSRGWAVLHQLSPTFHGFSFLDEPLPSQQQAPEDPIFPVSTPSFCFWKLWLPSLLAEM